MVVNILKLLTFIFCILAQQISAQEIWRESFDIPGKGVWGDNDGSTVHSDFSDVTTWSLDFSEITVTSPDDYAKTVKTGGGRFECRDIDGEVIWQSVVIDIGEYKNIRIELDAAETGSGKNTENKYLKAFYKTDNNEKQLFEINGENEGNWGAVTTKQNIENGERLQIIVHINNHYSSDKVILDEVTVYGEEKNPVIINRGDLVINEVLFNPVDEGSDYVEIYNNSDKQIPLNKLCLASRDKNLELTQIYTLSNKKDIFYPGEYLALTKDTGGVFPFFDIQCSNCFLEMNKFPSFNNDKDYVVLLNTGMEIIDELYYTKNMHDVLLADKEGVALERISVAAATNSQANWHSASTAAGYGTPGYKNSQAETDNKNSPEVIFEPEAFSPNSDGYNDDYIIKYRLGKTGYYINISIFDSAGRFITRLAQNEICGFSGEYRWNGKDRTGQRQANGVYVTVVEIFDLQGNIYKYKDGIVLTDIIE